MKKVMFLLFISIISLSSTIYASDSIPPESSTTYVRSGGSNKFLKEYNIHSTHNPDIKREYNTSNKSIKYTEVSEYSTTPSISTKKSNSTKSFRFKATHEVRTNQKSTKTTSPFRSNKWKR